MIKDMSPRNRPNSNTGSGLTPTGRSPGGSGPDRLRRGTRPGLREASRPALRRLFASATPASAAATPGRAGGPQADVDELVAPLGRRGLDAGGDVAPAAAAEPVAGLETEASIWSGIGATAAGETDVLATASAGDVGQRVEVLASAERGRTFAPVLGDLAVVAGG